MQNTRRVASQTLSSSQKFLEQKNYFSPSKKLVSANQAKTPLFFKLIWLQDLYHGQKSPSFENRVLG